jgi:hypothetical protein
MDNISLPPAARYLVCFVMSNHVHLVLCVDKDKAVSWSDKQVVGRWHRLHRGTLLSQKFMRNELLSESEWISLKETIAIYRQRLYDISWLMASLSEPIARQANKEDGCTGRFYSLPSLALTLRAS